MDTPVRPKAKMPIVKKGTLPALKNYLEKYGEFRRWEKAYRLVLERQRGSGEREAAVAEVIKDQKEFAEIRAKKIAELKNLYSATQDEEKQVRGHQVVPMPIERLLISRIAEPNSSDQFGGLIEYSYPDDPCHFDVWADFSGLVIQNNYWQPIPKTMHRRSVGWTSFQVDGRTTFDAVVDNHDSGHVEVKCVTHVVQYRDQPWGPEDGPPDEHAPVYCRYCKELNPSPTIDGILGLHSMPPIDFSVEFCIRDVKGGDYLVISQFINIIAIESDLQGWVTLGPVGISGYGIQLPVYGGYLPIRKSVRKADEALTAIAAGTGFPVD